MCEYLLSRNVIHRNLENFYYSRFCLFKETNRAIYFSELHN